MGAKMTACTEVSSASGPGASLFSYGLIGQGPEPAHSVKCEKPGSSAGNQQDSDHNVKSGAIYVALAAVFDKQGSGFNHEKTSFLKPAIQLKEIP